MTEKEFLTIALPRFSEPDRERLRQAVAFASAAHRGQARKSGEPYVEHAFAAAATLVDWNMDIDTVIAGILHDVPEDTDRTLEDVADRFGTEVATLVAGVTKLGRLKYRGLERYLENLRRMFVAMAEDVRVMIIKFADRRHNLETLAALPPPKRARIARESLEIFAPLADRLGMGEVKGQLEDLAFPHVYPKDYAWLQKIVGSEYARFGDIMERMLDRIRDELQAAHIPVTNVDGRRKHLYSLYRKLLRPEYNRDISRITDLIALRIVVPTVGDCYAALGIVHQAWKPMPQRFKDYIAQPKPNGYQSLHTAVFGPAGHAVEIQVRTADMHRLAEYGVAAHWHYAESGKPDAGRPVDTKLAWVQELAEWRHDFDTDEQFLESLKIDALRQRIFCFTPNGDVIDLPEGATPVDFAYHVHSDLGDRCIGAKINTNIAALDTELRSGDMVEILVNKSRKRPNADWLEFVKTENARQHIRRAFRDKLR